MKNDTVIEARKRFVISDSNSPVAERFGCCPQCGVVLTPAARENPSDHLCDDCEALAWTLYSPRTD